jgi:hypothetical protein
MEVSFHGFFYKFLEASPLLKIGLIVFVTCVVSFIIEVVIDRWINRTELSVKREKIFWIILGLSLSASALLMIIDIIIRHHLLIET